MSFDGAIERFQDILENIERIETYSSDVDYAALQNDLRTQDAIERCLARISEAAVKLDRLGSIAVDLCPNIPWADIRGIGNHLRHAYDGVDPEEIWNIVRNDLPALKKAVLAAIAQLEATQKAAVAKAP